MPLPPAVSEALADKPHDVIDCDPDFADTAAFCERYGYPLANSANTIVVASRRGPQVYAACMVAADRRLDVNHRVRRLLGVPKLSFASAEETRDVTDMEIGGVTPFGLPAELDLLVDAALMPLDYLIVGAGSRDAKIRIAPAVLAGLPTARVIDLSS